MRSLHNLGYWLGHDYLGIGWAPSRRSPASARRNTPKLARYRSPRDDTSASSSTIDEDVRARERLMLGLRLDDPLPLAGLEHALDPAGLARVEQLGLAERGDEH